MSLDKILVTLLGLAGIVFVYWFFLGKKEKEVLAKGSIDILVKGGYSPSTIAVKKNKKITINFLRKDENSCLEEVVIPDFKIKKFLPLNKTVSIEITPKEEGNFVFSCAMNMFHGRLIVK